MKRFLWFLILILVFSLQAFAAVPAFLTYSGKITDKNSNFLPDGTYDMRFTFWNTATGGTAALWTDNHYIADGNGVTVTAGGFNVLLGGPADFSVNYYLQTEVHINGNWEVFGRRKINSVAYAKQAEVANTANLANQVADNCITTSKIANGAVTKDQISSLPLITSGMIQGGTIIGGNSGNIAGGTITGGNIADGTINQTQAPYFPTINGINTAGIQNPKIAYGMACSNAGVIIVNFPFAFTSTPTVLCSTAHNGDPHLSEIDMTALTTTSVRVKTYIWSGSSYTQGGNIWFTWLAIGQ